MARIDLRLDVRPPAEFGEPLSIAATLFVPAAVPPGPLSLLACLHGGTYSRHYWDAQIDGWPGYSFADHFAGRGRLVLALDALGMGESSQPAREDLLSPRIGAQAHHLALVQVLEAIRAGDFGRELAGRPVDVTGIGHSMGGMLTLVQQAACASFDRVALLGWTNIGLALDEEAQAQVDAVHAMSGYQPGDRAAMRQLYYAADVPEAVIAADDARQSTTPASYSRVAVEARAVEVQAAAITVPVFLHFADIDISPAPHAEVAFYKSARHVTLTLLPGSAHCHNFAATRQQSWRDLDRWIRQTEG